MYSESSSDCDGVEYSYCHSLKHENSYQCNWQNLFYPTFEQPMVYYAQIPSTRNNNSSENKKKNPNCFVKAFRWYTQEHGESPKSQFTHNNPDLIGFATWLDNKYEQFVKENQNTQPMQYTRKLKSTNIDEPDKSQNRVQSEQTVKKFARIRSPWKKRKTNKKSNRSLEYILNPKDVSRPASERLTISQPSNCYSNPTLGSTEIKDSKKLINQSQSLSNIRDKSKYLNYLKSIVSSKTISTVNTKDVSCQCSGIIETNRETENNNIKETMNKIPIKNQKASSSSTMTRLCFKQKCCPIDKPTKTSSSHMGEMPKKGTVKRIINEFDTNHIVTCLCSSETSKIDVHDRNENDTRTLTNNNNLGKKQSLVTCALCKQTDSEVLKAFATLTKKASPNTVNNTVQTLDYPIILEKNNVHDYPLFMKVMYADKLDG